MLKKALQALLPAKWLCYFEVTDIKEQHNEWQITLVEKVDQIPAKLRNQNQEAVLDGYLNPTEINDFPLRGKPTYLKFIRRRWKIAGSDQDYFNTYKLHPEGAKATEEFGYPRSKSRTSFLKDFDREETDFLRGSR